MDDTRDHIAHNPFYVLGLRPDCSRMDIEREGQKLLAMLGVGLAAARSYPTPLGTVERTPEQVRLAISELRDPNRRLYHEFWARLPAETSVVNPDAAHAGSGPLEPWPEALDALGWGCRVKP